MGETASLSLINSTNADWEIVKSSSYQMNFWYFPEKITSKDAVQLIIERSGWIFNDHDLDMGIAEYKLLDSNESHFQISAKYHKDKGRFLISIDFISLQTDGNLPGSTLILGWTPDSLTTFILSGTEGSYTGTNLKTESWMYDNRKILGDLPLKSICITGSHDAGMSRITGGTAAGVECNTLTQSYDLLGQLNLGIRFFDIRPVISAAHYSTGHYSKVGFSWQGANGEPIQSIINGINSFTKNNNELIIIRLSHSLNTDLGNTSYRSFTQEEWDGLFDQLSKTKNLYYYQDDETGSPFSLANITLNKFTNNGANSAVLFVIRKDEKNKIDLGKRYKKGFFYLDDLNIYGKYSNTNDFRKMSDEQIKKMNNFYGYKYFLLYWTLTQSTAQSILCKLPGVDSIKDLANYANQNLSAYPYIVIDSSSYPNIINVDNVLDTNITAFAVAINYKVHSA
ncbi:hypothetical protein AB204_03710 [Xenorhabdus khoisanae]|uniref:Phosphatidylinositol diacylglycerol-lyase n=3 Tax=Xenorhabdus khoisanae TaxID=880157 RepID=A0A0J5FW90_9GAMM|nr:hypothetical protein AB204_03710 [Xenorhabdus khoisanae]